MLNKEYLEEQAVRYQEHVEAHVLARDRALSMNRPQVAEEHLREAATYAAIFNALSAIAAAKP